MRTPAALVVAALLVLAGCGAVPVSAPSSAPVGSSAGASRSTDAPSAAVPSRPSSGQPLLTVGFRGGHCRTGPCDRTIAIERDGAVHLVAPDRQALGVLPAGLFQAVQEQLSLADFEQLASRPFTGECPVNVDGQELIYTFYGATGEIRLASCEVELDPADPLFVAIENALAAVPVP